MYKHSSKSCEVEPQLIGLRQNDVFFFFGQRANNSAPIAGDHSTWGVGGLKGLLFRRRVSYCVCVCAVSGSGAVGVGGQCDGPECWRGTFAEFQ